MNKYVVAYYSNFDGSMLLEEVTATSRVAAGIKFLELEPNEEAVITTYDQLQQQAFDMDHAIGVIQIDKKNYSNSPTQVPKQVAATYLGTYLPSLMTRDPAVVGIGLQNRLAQLDSEACFQ